MGFKEVMALRQDKKLEEALVLAREDYKHNRDQWSASALFWVLKDTTDELIESKEEQSPKVSSYLMEMESLVGEMGATINVAMQSLEDLHRKVIPHYNDVINLAQEIKKSNRRDRIREIYATVLQWHTESPEGLHKSLHDYFAQIIVSYLDNQIGYLEYDAYLEINELYNSLQNTRPSSIHSRYLEIALKAKEKYDNLMNLQEFIDQWDLVNLTPNDWQRNDGKVIDYHSLAERTLKAIVTEFLDQDDKDKDVPAPVYQLLLDAISFYPNDELVQLTQARIQMIEGKKDLALDAYKDLLIKIEEPRAWMEFSLLIDDIDIKIGALCMTLRKEDDEYQFYLIKTRLELAKVLIEKELYENALRELNIVAQISLEKAYDLPEDYHMLLGLIPNDTVADKNNKEFYYPLSRPAQEYIYQPIPYRTMIVLDIIAIKLKQSKQVVPMLKLIDTNGNTALVSPKENGIVQGDNRGLCYEVKLLERPKRFTKVVLITLSEKQEPKKIFPTKIGRINGYNRVNCSHHIMDTDSRHHYLQGNENDYTFGEFIEFVHILEQSPQRKNDPKNKREGFTTREYLLLPSRIDPLEAIDAYPVTEGTVLQVREDDYIIMTENHVRSYVMHSIPPTLLEEDDKVLLRGFQQRHRDRRTGEITYSYTTLAVEPYYEL